MAGYTLTIKLVGAEALRKALTNTSPLAKQELSNALNKAANDATNIAVDNMKKSTPSQLHKTGQLWGSMHVGNPHSVSHMASPDNLQAVVGTNLEYAKAQEYGTQGMTINVPDGRRISKAKPELGRTRPYTFTGNIKPKYFLRDAMPEVKTKLTTYLEEAARRIIQGITNGK